MAESVRHPNVMCVLGCCVACELGDRHQNTVTPSHQSQGVLAAAGCSGGNDEFLQLQLRSKKEKRNNTEKQIQSWKTNPLIHTQNYLNCTTRASGLKYNNIPIEFIKMYIMQSYNMQHLQITFIGKQTYCIHIIAEDFLLFLLYIKLYCKNCIEMPVYAKALNER